MDLELGTGANHNAQIISQLGDLDQLYDLARERSTEAREALASAVSSVLENELTTRESELVADVLISLLKQAEVDVRHAMAERLSTMDDVPLRLVLHLANDEIEVAKPILNNSSALGDFDLLYIIKSKPAEYWREIAVRTFLSEQVMGELARTGDFETALRMVENQNISMTSEVLVILSDIAQGQEGLAVPLLQRSEVTSDIAKRLYRHVSEDIKQFICENYDVGVEKIDVVAEEIQVEFVNPGLPKDFSPDVHILDSAAKLKEQGMLSVGMMLNSLRRGQIKSFIAQFSAYVDLPVASIGRILSQSNGQGLAIVCKAYGIEKQEFLSIFMLTGKIWNYGRLAEASDVQKAMAYYNKATQDLAIKIVNEKMRY